MNELDEKFAPIIYESIDKLENTLSDKLLIKKQKWNEELKKYPELSHDYIQYDIKEQHASLIDDIEYLLNRVEKEMRDYLQDNVEEPGTYNRTELKKLLSQSISDAKIDFTDNMKDSHDCIKNTMKNVRDDYGSPPQLKTEKISKEESYHSDNYIGIFFIILFFFILWWFNT